MNLNGISIGHGIVAGQAAYLLGGIFLILIGIAVLYTLLLGSTRVSPAAWVWGIGSLAAGCWLSWHALSAQTPSLLLWVVAGAIAIYLVWRVRRIPRPAAGRVVAPPVQLRATVTGTPPRRTGLIFCLVGVGIIAVAFIPAQRLLQLRSGTHTVGIVTSLESNTANNSDPNILPRVQFTGTDGSIVRFLDRTGSNPAPFKVGDRVTVLYTPGNPASAMIDRGNGNWQPIIMLVILGCTFAGLGLFSLRRA